MVVEYLGLAYVKIAQLLGLRADLIPVELIRELEKLQDTVAPFPVEEVHGTIERELGLPVEQLFSEFSDEPQAAGSLAQVHAARLNDGQMVVVKIQRPSIRVQTQNDIEILHHLACMLEKYIPNIRTYNLSRIVEEFARTIERELDFNFEASQLEKFRSCYQEMDYLVIPELFREYATRNILVIEHIAGIKVSNITAIEASGMDRAVIARRGAEAILTQIFEKGYFHADPHPGNLLVLEGNKICFLDYGMMGNITPTTRKLLISIFVEAVFHDSDSIVRNILRMCETQGRVSQRQLETAVNALVDEFFFIDLHEMDIKRLIFDMLRLFQDNNRLLPADMYLLVRCLLLLQANGEKLDPDFNFSEYVQPFIRKLFRRRLSLSKLAKDLYLSVEELTELGHTLPFDIRDIVRSIKEGKIRIEFEHHGLESVEQTLASTCNRLAFAVIVAAILIGSSLVIFSGLPPLWRGIPIIGIIGFTAAGLLGIWLQISIIRHGRM